MNTKIQRITETIAKLRLRITSDQARLRELERQKLEIENAEIVASIRAINVPPEELAELLQQLKSQPVPNLGRRGAESDKNEEEELPIEN